MNYRTANEKDFLQLAEMRWEFQTEEEAEKPSVEKETFLNFCTEYFRECFEKEDWIFFVAEENEEIVSHIFVKRIVSIPRPVRLENFWGYLTNVYTKPRFRGCGIGANLLKEVKLWATEKDFELLLVSPSETSINFYKREGFVAETDFYQLRLREF